MGESFNEYVKKELLNAVPEERGGMVAYLSAAVRAAAEITVERKNPVLRFLSSSGDYIQVIEKLIKTLYKTPVEAASEVIKSGLKKGQTIYALKIPTGTTKALLADAGIMKSENGEITSLSSGIDAALIAEELAAKNYVKSLFLGCGSVYIPEDAARESSGYHLEFSLQSGALAENLSDLLRCFGLEPRLAERKEQYIVYIKDREMLSNFFAALSASNAVMKIQEIIIEREVANKLNREANFSASNIDKTYKASAKLIVALEIIEKKLGLSSLPPHLLEVAKLRREFPLASYEELQSKLPDVGKSGLNHRFRKIIQIAESLNDKD
ncbi:MAG: DNA-binding protein WhiA [Christensenellales bacterium]|jgi:DNA-binding protein WhiA|nr:DNA-binding protein WhiA [Clostridia bacterium]HRU84472.1 DNA-binding protein WhiA [Eubacteriales bacterium]